MTTREPLTDLADFQRRPDAAWGSVLRVDLSNLTDAELLAASREVDGHALTLNLLGRFLHHARRGDIRQRDRVKFEEADRKEQGGTTFKMLAAFENWFAESGEIEVRSLAALRMLGLFDRPADAGCIAALRKPPVIAGLTDPLFTTRRDASTGQTTVQPLLEEDWNTATSFLADFGLVVVQTDTDNRELVLDCHPLIREYFAKQLRTSDTEGWRSAHRRLYEYRKNSTEFQPKTLEMLQPLYQAVAHGCRAGLAEQVRVSVYRDRIVRNDESYSTNILGGFGADLAAMASFFEVCWTKFAPGISESGQAWLLNHLSYCLRASGRLTESLEPQKAALELRVRQCSWKNATVVALNLRELALVLGHVSEAIRDAEQASDFSDRSGDQRALRLIARASLAESFHQAGRSIDAQKCFREVEAIGDDLGFGSRPFSARPAITIAVFVSTLRIAPHGKPSWEMHSQAPVVPLEAHRVARSCNNRTTPSTHSWCDALKWNWKRRSRSIGPTNMAHDLILLQLA